MPKNDPFFDFGTPLVFGPEVRFFFFFFFQHFGIFFALREQSHFKNERIYRSIEMGGGPNLKILRCKKNSEMPNFFFRASGPKIRGVQKSKKRSFFGIKNVKNFESGIHIFFSQKFFNPSMRPKGHFALKCTFPMETIVKKNLKNSQNFQNFAKLFFQKKIKNRKIK